MMDLPGHIRRLMEYETDCTERVIGSLERARYALEHGGEAAEAAPWVRAVEIFAHIQAARQLWLARLGEMSPPEDGVFPSWPFERAVERARALDTAWSAYVGGLDGAALDRSVEYRTTEGEGCRSTVLEIASHVVNHSSYHRGQVASLVAQTGASPAVTDLIFFTRRAGRG